MVTVGLQGGPGVNMNIFQALRAWLDPSEAVVPETELYPAGQSAQQTQAQDTEEMTGSQQLATAAALTELHIPYQTLVDVVSTVPGYPASKVLKAGDVIEAVDGKAVDGQTSLSSMITAHPAGSVLTLEVLRAGKTLTHPGREQGVGRRRRSSASTCRSSTSSRSRCRSAWATSAGRARA